MPSKSLCTSEYNKRRSQSIKLHVSITNPQFLLTIYCRSYYSLIAIAHISVGRVFSKEYLHFFMKNVK